MVENILRGPVVCVDDKNTIILNKHDYSNLNNARNMVCIHLLHEGEQIL